MTGGIIQHQATDIEVQCLPSAIPEYIEVDISKLDVNDKVMIGDIKLKDITIKENPEQFLVKVSTTRMAASMVIEEEEEAEEVEEGAEEGAEGETSEGEASGQEGGGEEQTTE